MHDDDLFVDRTPRRVKVRRWCRHRALPAVGRRARAMAVPGVVTGLLFTGLLWSAQSARTTDPGNAASTPATQLGNLQPIDYKEECQSEGCNNEEMSELYNSLQNECGAEMCWSEEVLELSGGPHLQLDPQHNPNFVAMLNKFTQLHPGFVWPSMKLGVTETVWTDFLHMIDGKVIKTPKTSCDPYCG
jgi:hypothetical protein